MVTTYARLKVISPLTQYGRFWVKTIETYDAQERRTRRYRFVYVRMRIVKAQKGPLPKVRVPQTGRTEFQLIRIRETAPFTMKEYRAMKEMQWRVGG